MFESQYNDEMEAEVKRLEAQMRAVNAGHPEWVAVNSHHQYVAKDGDHAQIEVCWKLVRWLRRTELTWEDVERKSVK